MKERKKRRPRKLTSGMVWVIVTFQIIPYIILSAVLIRFYSVRNYRQTENTVITSMENAGTLVMENILSAIDLSRQASYDGVIKQSYETWLKDGDESAMYREVSNYLSRTYKFSRSISNTILLYMRPVTMEYYTYSNMAGATYANIDEFRNNTAQAVRLAAQDLDTRTVLVYLSGHLYVIRNIVLSNYEPFTTLVMEVNMDRLFEQMNNVIWGEAWMAALEGDVVYTSSKEEGQEESLLSAGRMLREKGDIPRDGSMSTVYSQKDAAAFMNMKVNGQVLSFVQLLDRDAIVRGRNEFLILYVVVFVTLIPLLIAMFYYFYSNINKPIGALMKGSDRIRKGEYGYRVESFDGNEEIGRLVDTFNHMSVSLEDSFNRIYVEEIAERDATLKALQSQINPHFLNNTLEIINWKARMNGNEDVSEMISALSVMMNATLNRNNEMFIPMSEELSYVDAYLYIIRERFGNHFSFTTQVDGHLSDVLIPRLIIQPIVENAVEHGSRRDGVLYGKLTVCAEGPFLVITVENSGEMSGEDLARVERLLDDASLKEEQRGSIGIRNVHQRLRIIYGPQSGLQIHSDGEGNTVCSIRILREGRGETETGQTGQTDTTAKRRGE